MWLRDDVLTSLLEAQMFRNCTQASGVLQDLLLIVNLINDQKNNQAVDQLFKNGFFIVFFKS